MVCFGDGRARTGAVEIRRVPYETEDYGRLLELRRLMLREPLGLDWSAADLEHEEVEWHFGAWERGRIVGCLSVRWMGVGRAKLRQMAVATGWRGRGVGRRMVEEVLEVVSREGARVAELHSREGAVGFYERLGFTVKGNSFEEVGILHRKMAKACGGAMGALDTSGMEHHVYFWLKEERKNEADQAQFEAGLTKLAESACLSEGRWAKPAATPVRPVTDHSWSYAISFRFATMDDHDKYQGDDPHHVEFVEAFKDWWDQVQVRDLEC